MKKRLSILVASLMALASPVTAAEPDMICPAERAVYVLESEDGGFHADLIRAEHYASIASNLYLRVTSPQRAYWFKFSVSNGYSRITAIPISDPYAEEAREDGPRELLAEMFEDPETEDLASDTLGTLIVYSFAPDLTVFPDPPNAGEQAPAYLMIPELGLTLWYSPQDITEDESASRDPIPIGMFKLSECRDEPLPNAFP
jgi:hypothetical protein